MAYEKTDWQEGDLITEERLDKMEQGIADGQNVDVITSVKATGLAAGAAPTASLADGVLTLGIPAGATGAAGAPGKAGTNGTNGAAGPAGKSVTALALTTDASGKVTGGTVTFSDKTTAAVTVTQATA